MAANTVFIIYDTAGTPIAAIEPNTYNGPGGVQQSSDLSLFGLGYATWGQASDQNDFRLLENFACPQSILNPSPVQPMGTAELGSGNGINAPTVGQLWFNTTAQEMYVYTEPSQGTFVWATVSNPVIVAQSGLAANAPASASVGQLYYATDLAQLEVFNGTSWNSVAAKYLPLAGGTMTGAFSMGMNQIHNVANPSAPYDAVNLQYMQSAISGVGAGVFVPLAGGTMTGQLTMSSTGIVLNSGSITTNTGNVTLNTGTLTINSPPSGIAMTANGRILNVTTSGGTDAASSNYGDGRWLIKSTGTSQTVSGPINFTGTTTFAVVGSGSLGATGYWKIPGGPMFMWGTIPANGSTQPVDFNITFSPNFPSACTYVGVTTNRSVASRGQAIDGSNFATNISTSGCTVTIDYTGTDTSHWFAIGY